MEIISTTPFGQRPVTAGLLARQKLAMQDSHIKEFDKWELFRELCVARLSFKVSDRDLTVLNALLSFHQARVLNDRSNLIVFPSNKILAERAHGMAESTLRRHLSALVGSGLITRHDSPNGKRYAAKDSTGTILRAFGFNLRPLLVLADEIVERAAEARKLVDHKRRLREESVVIMRDVFKLSEYGIEIQPLKAWDGLLSVASECQRRLRRKLTLEAYEDLLKQLRTLLDKTHRFLGMYKTSRTNKMSVKDVQSERHYHNSNKDSYDFEPALEKTKGERFDQENKPSDKEGRGVIKLPLGLVLKTCLDIQDYAKDGISNWYDFVCTAEFVRSMMGVSPDAWVDAKNAMGPENASVVLACMLQRVDKINSPGGYLRRLTQKAEQNIFSPGPMVMALLNSEAGQAA